MWERRADDRQRLVVVGAFAKEDGVPLEKGKLEKLLRAGKECLVNRLRSRRLRRRGHGEGGFGGRVPASDVDMRDVEGRGRLVEAVGPPVFGKEAADLEAGKSEEIAEGVLVLDPCQPSDRSPADGGSCFLGAGGGGGRAPEPGQQEGQTDRPPAEPRTGRPTAAEGGEGSGHRCFDEAAVAPGPIATLFGAGGGPPAVVRRRLRGAVQNPAAPGRRLDLNRPILLNPQGQAQYI